MICAGCTEAQYIYAIWEWDPLMSWERASQGGDFGATPSPNHQVQVGKNGLVPSYPLTLLRWCNRRFQLLNIESMDSSLTWLKLLQVVYCGCK